MEKKKTQYGSVSVEPEFKPDTTIALPQTSNPTITPNFNAQQTAFNPTAGISGIPQQVFPQTGATVDPKTGKVTDLAYGLGSVSGNPSGGNLGFKSVPGGWMTEQGFMTDQQKSLYNDLLMRKAATTPAQPELNPLSSEVGMLTPEQQAIAQGSTAIPDRGLDANILLQSAAQKAAYGAAGGAGIGAVAGLGAFSPATAAAGAAVGAVGGAITGVITGLFSMYQHRSGEKVEYVDNNIQAAQSNINKAIRLAGLGDDSVALKEYNNAYAELLLTQRQLQEQSKDTYEYKTGVREKQQELEIYMANTLPIMEARMQLAINKPNPAYAYASEQ